MESIHLILLNLIYDLSCNRQSPGTKWMRSSSPSPASGTDASSIGKFMLWIGPHQLIFDWTTHRLLYLCLLSKGSLSHTGILWHNRPPAYYSLRVRSWPGCSRPMPPCSTPAGSWSPCRARPLVIPHDPHPCRVLQSRASRREDAADLYRIAVLDRGFPLRSWVPTLLGLVAPPAAYFAYLDPLHRALYDAGHKPEKAYVRHYGELL